MALRGLVRSGKKGKSPPYFSQEFVIQNHGDIVSCICMFIMIGLMFQATQSVAQVFIAAQHNVTRVVGEGDAQEELVLFNAGGRDVATIFFYTLAWIVVHAIIQEYILDKFNKKLHLSKTKHSKLNDAGSVLPFYLLSVGFGVDLVNKNSTFPNLSKLWEEYPQSEMNFMVKFYFILQIAFWLHNFPELFFMKTRKEEYSNKITTYCLYLAFIVPAYIMSGSQVALLLLTIHYIPEAVLTFTRLLHYSGANDLAKHGFLLWAVLFILARLATISLTLLILGFGLTKLEVSSINLSTGNYNTQFMRIVWVAAIVLNQAWMCWNFIVFQMRRYRESLPAEDPRPRAAKKDAADKKKAKKKEGEVSPRAEKQVNGRLKQD